MIVGVPREVKDNEYRVGLLPSGAASLKSSGHSIIVETGAGSGSGFPDSEYRSAGAEVTADRKHLFDKSEIIVKVKEPTPEEYDLFGPGQIIFTFLHLASSRELTLALMEKKVTAVGYETIETANGELPLLVPMSEVAGKLSVYIGAGYLRKDMGGRGVLLGGVTGVRRGRVCIIGGGVVGTNAARVARGLGAEVTVLDINQDRLAYLEDLFHGTVETLMSNPGNLEESAVRADILVGAVLLAGGKAPVLVSEDLVKRMRPGSVIVDVAVDQGGCIATIHPTTHSEPTYVCHGVIHYGVTNIPGIVPETSTCALTNVTMPYIERISTLGLGEAMSRDPALRKGLNLYKGILTQPHVAEAHELPWEEPERSLAK